MRRVKTQPKAVYTLNDVPKRAVIYRVLWGLLDEALPYSGSPKSTHQFGVVEHQPGIILFSVSLQMQRPDERLEVCCCIESDGVEEVRHAHMVHELRCGGQSSRRGIIWAGAVQSNGRWLRIGRVAYDLECQLHRKPCEREWLTGGHDSEGQVVFRHWGLVAAFTQLSPLLLSGGRQGCKRGIEALEWRSWALLPDSPLCDRGIVVDLETTSIYVLTSHEGNLQTTNNEHCTTKREVVHEDPSQL